MCDSKSKCVLILSAKSSGSTALQNLLTALPQVHHVDKTRHYETETLFWTKAASVLDMPQVDMLKSEVPIARDRARSELVGFLRDNLGTYSDPQDDEELIFGGWHLLCQRFSPVFVEKSPHHLHQWSALSLILDCMKRLPNVEFLLIGLIRNPMDTLYSMWKRFHVLPEEAQYEWQTAYENLLKLKQRVPNRLVIVRYEDMVADTSSLKQVFEFAGATKDDAAKFSMHRKSLKKWEQDGWFGFQLSDDVARLATEYGYQPADVANPSHLFWDFYKHAPSLARRHRLKRMFS